MDIKELVDSIEDYDEGAGWICRADDVLKVINTIRIKRLRSEIEKLESAERVKSKIGFEKPGTKMQQIKQRVFAQGYNKAKDEFITRYKEELKVLESK